MHSQHLHSAVVTIAFGVLALGSADGDGSPGPPKDPHQQRIEQCFSLWDGSHRGVEKLLKKNLRDPSSYEHIETRFGEDGPDHLKVYLEYRSRNGFGGMSTGQVLARAHKDNCNDVEIIASE
jgi:hypothetical protein